MKKNIIPASAKIDANCHAPLFLSVKETRRRLSLGHTTIYALINSGRLKSCLFGRKRLVEAASVEALAAEFLSCDS